LYGQSCSAILISEAAAPLTAPFHCRGFGCDLRRTRRKKAVESANTSSRKPKATSGAPTIAPIPRKLRLVAMAAKRVKTIVRSRPESRSLANTNSRQEQASATNTRGSPELTTRLEIPTIPRKRPITTPAPASADARIRATFTCDSPWTLPGNPRSPRPVAVRASGLLVARGNGTPGRRVAGATAGDAPLGRAAENRHHRPA
jgi:hypothetical protein